MVNLPKIIGIACGLLLSVGLSTVAQTEIFTPRSGGQSVAGKIIQGEVLRIEGNDCVIKSQDGKEVRLQIDLAVLKAISIEPGTHIEATVNEQNHVLSFRPDDHGSPK